MIKCECDYSNTPDLAGCGACQPETCGEDVGSVVSEGRSPNTDLPVAQEGQPWFVTTQHPAVPKEVLKNLVRSFGPSMVGQPDKDLDSILASIDADPRDYFTNNECMNYAESGICMGHQELVSPEDLDETGRPKALGNSASS
jgi:hypothetical protein